VRLGARVAAGVASGAVGTTALNAATYVDMAVRGRPASQVPEQATDVLLGRAGLALPGEGEVRAARRSGLAALLGIATGLAVGGVYGVVRPAARGVATPAAGVLLGLGAMAAANAGNVRLGVTDPREWSAADWAADVLPHLAYGLCAALAYEGLAPR
jgi:hypothetical protein